MTTKAKSPVSIAQAKKDGNSPVNQEIKRKFIEREVYSNVNSMVEYILRKSYEANDAPFSIDDIENYYSYPEYNGTYARFDGGTEEQRNAEINRLENMFEESGSDVDAIQAEINELDRLESEPNEVYEWWLVSSNLCDKLAEKGHPVIKSEGIWGRCTTGQAILLDGVITEICAEMEILQGQRNSWENK